MKSKRDKSVERLHRDAFKALKIAVRKALAQHAAAGVPAAVWENGKVVNLSPRQIKAFLRKRKS